MSIYKGTEKVSTINIISSIDTDEGTATSADILEGKIAFSKKNKLVGTIPSIGSKTYVPTIVDQNILSGNYLSGNQILKGDSNLIAANIKKGVELFGITGTLESSGGSSVKKETILDTTTSTSKQDTIDNWSSKVLIKDGNLEWMNLSDLVNHWGGVEASNNFIGDASQKYGIYMTNWTEQDTKTSILFTTPIDLIAGELLITLNCNISSWMNQTMNINLMTATGETEAEILSSLKEKISAENYDKVIATTYVGSSSLKDTTIIETLGTAGRYYMYITGFKKADNSAFNLISIKTINF